MVNIAGYRYQFIPVKLVVVTIKRKKIQRNGREFNGLTDRVQVTGFLLRSQVFGKTDEFLCTIGNPFSITKL